MRLLVTHDEEEIEGVFSQIEIAASWSPSGPLLQAPNLRWLQQWGAGADWLMGHPEAVERDFVLTNASGVHAIPISEHILALLLTFARHLHLSVHAQARHEWLPFDQLEDVFELAGKTMVLVGVGAIGGRTARMADALGVRVLGVRRHPAVDAPGVAKMLGPGELLDVLPEADCVVLAAPLTHETQGMIGERELRAMKPTSYIVNIGRGRLIQEHLLIDALQERWIAGAGLDVFETEPLPEDSPLWDMDNVVITRHYAGFNPDYHLRATRIFVDNLQRYVAGRPLRNVVDKQLGY
jgi:phosphoglycerate dehydrogenase-like enzyme